jgi:hypothetical protein
VIIANPLKIRQDGGLAALQNRPAAASPPTDHHFPQISFGARAKPLVPLFLDASVYILGKVPD